MRARRPRRVAGLLADHLDPVATDGLIWASGSTVHLPDGSTIDTGDLAGAYVVAGAGVWFASAEPDEREGNVLPQLRVATADGVEDLGAHPAIGSLTTSEDGRWLAFIDRLEAGAGSAEAVVVDLTTGEEVVRSSEDSCRRRPRGRTGPTSTRTRRSGCSVSSTERRTSRG